ncbi:UNVERIFIED_CONTAM: hypothetical protein FKN15_055347 [Acipenser sinensis]
MEKLSAYAFPSDSDEFQPPTPPPVRLCQASRSSSRSMTAPAPPVNLASTRLSARQERGSKHGPASQPPPQLHYKDWTTPKLLKVLFENSIPIPIPVTATASAAAVTHLAHPLLQQRPLGPRQRDVSANQGFHERPSKKPQMLGTSLIFSRGAAFRVITLTCVFSVTVSSAPGMVAPSPPVGDPFLSSVARSFAPEMVAASPSVGDHLFYPVSVAGSSAPGMCGIVALSQ